MKQLLPLIIICYMLLGSSCSFANKLFAKDPQALSGNVAQAPAQTQTVTIEDDASVPQSVVIPASNAAAAQTGTGQAAQPAQQMQSMQQPATAAQSTAMPGTAQTVQTSMPQQNASVMQAIQPLQNTRQAQSPAGGNDSRKMDRAARRAAKAEAFAARIDSVVNSRNFVFMPNSMQEVPSGQMQLIYTEYFYLGITDDHVEVHLPVVRGGVMQYIQILNFDTFGVKGYQASRTSCGWNISFTVTDNQTSYAVNLLISTVTGEATLTLLTMNNTMRYVGYISNPVE